MRSAINRALMVGGVSVTLTAVAACAPKPVAPPPPPPPPPVVYTPARPLPPGGAAASLFIPPVGVDGVRRTVNTGITPAQRLWNIRSAYNVAALNCTRPEHIAILNGYKAFIKAHAKPLTAAYRAVDSEFRSRYGANFVPPREAYMTQVYNYYANPPTVSAFCNAALVMAQDSLALKTADLPAFAERSMMNLEAVMENFFRAYEKYRADAAAWDAQYGRYGYGAPATGAAAGYGPAISPQPMAYPSATPSAAATPR